MALFETSWDVVAFIGSALFAAALLPQYLRTRKLGHAHDISVWFLFTVLAASLATGIWALHLGERGYSVAGTQVLNLIVWGYILHVRLHPRSPVETPTHT